MDLYNYYKQNLFPQSSIMSNFVVAILVCLPSAKRNSSHNSTTGKLTNGNENATPRDTTVYTTTGSAVSVGTVHPPGCYATAYLQQRETPRIPQRLES